MSTKNPVFCSFLAGSMSGTCSTVLFQPLELVKTRLQVQPALCCTARRGSRMASVVTAVLRQEKLSGLWRGLTPSLSRCVPGVGIYFSTLTTISRWTVGDRKATPLESVGLGATARTLACGLMLPFTVVKTRFESGQFNYSNVLHALLSVIKTEGWGGLYSGLSATLVRDVPFSGVFLMFYSYSKETVSKSAVAAHSPATGHLLQSICAFSSSLLACALTHPADVIKTRMQCNLSKQSAWSVSLCVAQSEGGKAFLKGLTPRLLRRSLMTAMSWTIYEQIYHQLSLR